MLSAPRTRCATSSGHDITHQVLGHGRVDLLVVPPGFSVMEPAWARHVGGAFLVSERG